MKIIISLLLFANLAQAAVPDALSMAASEAVSTEISRSSFVQLGVATGPSLTVGYGYNLGKWETSLNLALAKVEAAPGAAKEKNANVLYKLGAGVDWNATFNRVGQRTLYGIANMLVYSSYWGHWYSFQSGPFAKFFVGQSTAVRFDGMFLVAQIGKSAELPAMFNPQVSLQTYF